VLHLLRTRQGDGSRNDCDSRRAREHVLQKAHQESAALHYKMSTASFTAAFGVAFSIFSNDSERFQSFTALCVSVDNATNVWESPRSQTHVSTLRVRRSIEPA